MNNLHLSAELVLPSSSAPAAGPALARAWATVRGWAARARGRNELAEIDEHLLKDIGMTRSDVLMETRKPFWRA
jgi:uncharacterized protein YjiS (DUF1127 family)